MDYTKDYDMLSGLVNAILRLTTASSVLLSLPCILDGWHKNEKKQEK